MSTTLKINVASVFAQNNGLIVQMIPGPFLRYFDVRWLSKYPDEQEFLFIGGQRPMYFMNIIHTSHFVMLKKYIEAIRIIETMFNGYYFTQDPTVCVRVENNGDNGNGYELNLEKLGVNNDISSEIKRITSDLIDHEANKYKP
eukprot:493118_1